jgi:hypothetical protein
MHAQLTGTFPPTTSFLNQTMEVRMRMLVVVVATCLILALPAISNSTQARLELRDIQNHPFAVDCPFSSRLRLHLRSGDIRIVGHQDSRISVRLDGRNANNAQDLTVRFKRTDNDADLHISGGPKNDLRITIEVPAFSMLYVRMPAGELNLEGVSGDKDVELHAGDLTISVGSPSDYARVDASVYTGDLEAPPFGEYHGGLFRSFNKRGPGKYTLHAHVGAGDLTLR